MDDERVSVVTYLPRYQKERWADHADRLDMSQSEFVRTMVQAGRADFEVPQHPGESQPPIEETGPPDRNGADGANFEARIRVALERDGVLDWEDLVEALVDDVESDLEDALDELQAADEIRYRPREGGYVLVNDEQ